MFRLITLLRLILELYIYFLMIFYTVIINLCKFWNEFRKHIIIRKKKTQMYDHGIEFFCGCMSGWAQVLTMQPFEIIKVRLANQSLLNPIYQGIGDCFRRIYNEEGFSAFYKGTLSPLLGIGAQVALQFGTNELVKKMMFKLSFDEEEGDQNSTLPMNLILLSGILTGIPSSLVITPVDHTRIKMQNIQTKQYKGSIDAGIKIYKQFGVRGMYQGFYPTILREVIALGVYFSSYEALVRRFNRQRLNPPSTIVSFLAGGMSGALSWLFTYPIDYIKTIVQSDPVQNRKYATATQAVISKYREEGIRTFFKGMGVTMLRSFPVNGTGFVTFQYFRHRLTRND